MFGRMKTGWKALGLLTDFKALWKVQTRSGVPSNIWGHKRTWLLLGSAVGLVGSVVAGEISIFEWVGQNKDLWVLIAGWMWLFFKGMRDTMKDETDG